MKNCNISDAAIISSRVIKNEKSREYGDNCYVKVLWVVEKIKSVLSKNAVAINVQNDFSDKYDYIWLPHGSIFKPEDQTTTKIIFICSLKTSH